jgi:hypothetical protein
MDFYENPLYPDRTIRRQGNGIYSSIPSPSLSHRALRDAAGWLPRARGKGIFDNIFKQLYRLLIEKPPLHIDMRFIQTFPSHL